MIESQIIESFSNEATTSIKKDNNSPIQDSFINSLTEGFVITDKEDPHKIVERFTSGTTTIIGIIILLVIAYLIYVHLNKKVSV